MESIFTALNHAVTGAPFVALAAATAWGILSIVLSPCHLASIPLIVGFIDGQGRMSTGRAFLISSLFSVGILLTIALVGLLTAAAGRMFGDVGPWGNWLVALIFFVVGLHLLDLIPLPWAGPSPVGMARKGLLAAFLLGLIFGIALGPCTFAFLAPMLGVTFSLGTDRMLFGAALLLAYGIGHCSVIVLAGTFTGAIQRYLDWTERSKGALLLKKVCGVLVIFGGVWMIYSTP